MLGVTVVSGVTGGVTAGFTGGFINPVLGAVNLERIPAPLLGRVSALNSALCWSLIPFGGLVGGLVGPPGTTSHGDPAPAMG